MISSSAISKFCLTSSSTVCIERKISSLLSHSYFTFFRSWWGMPLPHLDCSEANLTRLPVKGALENTKSISLSYNRMLEFHIDDLEPFPNLEKLELKFNQLTRIVASSSSPKLKLNSVNFISMT